MPTIASFYGILIQIFWREHGPPHFHALYAEHEALIDIRTLEVMQGQPAETSSGAGAGMGLGAPRRIDGGLGPMQSHADAEEDRATELTPPVRPLAPWRVAEVEALPGFRLRVRFNDGTEGTVEMADFINSDAAGVFAALRDEKVFWQARVTLGAVTWPGDLDLAPDAMHREIKEHGKWTVT
jgi:hypothetical protein